MSTILIGADASEQSEDAIAFGRRLASISGASVLIASVETNLDRQVGASADHGVLVDAAEGLRHDVHGLERIAANRVRVRAVMDPSPAHALTGLAATEGVAIIVVGSSRTSTLGRVTPGSTGERLLHGAPCAVAIVPHGYRTRSDDRFLRIGVAFDESVEAHAAVAAAVELARALGAVLEVIGVVDAGVHAALTAASGVGYLPLAEDIERTVQEGLDSLLDRLPSDVIVVALRLAGDPAQRLVDRSAELDLLVTGSRGYGALRSVLVGGVSGRVVRDAGCPVVVVPRGADAPLGALFDTAAPVAASGR